MRIDLQIETAPVFEPLLASARYKGAKGGRGSGKSHFFAGLAVDSCMDFRGTRGLCVREVQKTLKESAKRLIEDKIHSFGVSHHFDILNTEIKTPGGGVISFIGMQDHTAESIMSFEALDWVWVEQAETLSARSLEILRPTIRKPGSQLWFSWNRRRKTDPVDMLLTGENPPKDSVVVSANWRDNPWLPQVLRDERDYDFANSPDTYAHIWEGDYISIQKGAYFASQLEAAKREERIGRVSADPLQAHRVYCDLGGQSRTADAFTMWVVQFIGREIRVLDYYETQGQPAAHHFAWLRQRGYEAAYIYLPHDGTQQHGPNPTTWEGAFKSAGWVKTEVIENQGAGAARQRIEAARRLFPSIWFNDTTTQAGRDALGWYHEKRDANRDVGLGPDHDWSSHAADAFGLMCMAYEAPKIKRQDLPEIRTISPGEANTAWLGN